MPSHTHTFDTVITWESSVDQTHHVFYEATAIMCKCGRVFWTWNGKVGDWQQRTVDSRLV